MNYDEALAYILASFNPAQKIVAHPDANRNLLRLRSLLDHLGAPDQHYRKVVIAGTKGKGSTAAILASILRVAGMRVGLYSQPHLHDYRERIRVDGEMISHDDLVAGVMRLQPAVVSVDTQPNLGPISTYDLGTALAIDHFAAAKVDIAVLEVGIGGRYDSVNTIIPDLSIITAISLDHVEILGSTIAQIAAEKAGIIKDGVPVIAQRQQLSAATVLTRTAAAHNADFAWADQVVTVAPTPQSNPASGVQTVALTFRQPPFSPRHPIVTTLPLLGHVQWANAATAISAALRLAADGHVTLTTSSIARGLSTAYWPGRFEIVRQEPLTIVDGAHNADSAQQLSRALAELYPGRPYTLVLGVSPDKDTAGIAAALVPAAAQLVLTVSSHPRSAPTAALEPITAPYQRPTTITTDVASAIAAAEAVTPPDGLIIATGSLFVAGDARAAVGLTEASILPPA